MVRKIVSATASAALCMMSIAPAMAQNYSYVGFDAPRGATATANLRVPLGRAAAAKAKPSYGLTFGFGQEMGGQALDGRTTTRQMRFADIRFTGAGKLQQANVASFNLNNLDDDKRLNMFGGSTILVVGLVAAGVAVCLAADCFGGDDDDDDDDDN